MFTGSLKSLTRNHNNLCYRYVYGYGYGYSAQVINTINIFMGVCYCIGLFGTVNLREFVETYLYVLILHNCELYKLCMFGIVFVGCNVCACQMKSR